MAENVSHPKTHTRARAFAVVTLAALVGGLGYLGHEGYRAATDAFVAPMILSPDSEIVLQSKAKLSELSVERERLTAEAESLDADLAAADKALSQLRALSGTMGNALEWTKAVTAQQAAATYREIDSLAKQRQVLLAMKTDQSHVTTEASRNLTASLISRTEHAKEHLSLGQIELALLENDRARVQQNNALNQAYFAQRSLARGETAMMPEAIVREEQLVRIELDVARLESEQRAKRAEKKVVASKLAKMDELSQQLRARPLFRATDKSVEVAFVPYTQIDGVAADATVYDCIWSVFHCKPVGAITELLPGEVVMPDPWGTMARGQYAMLSLTEHGSARSKVLRVRGDGRQRSVTPVTAEATALR